MIPFFVERSVLKKILGLVLRMRQMVYSRGNRGRPGGSLFENDIRSVFLYGLLNDLWGVTPNTFGCEIRKK